MDQVLDFVKRVFHLRLKWDFSVTSWGRSIKHNKDVWGEADSLHMLWTGLDVVFVVMEKNVDFEKDATRCGLLAIYEKDHYHLQPAG